MTKKITSSEAGKTLGELGASKGGKARAEKLSPEQRSEIAKSAVEARWAKVDSQAIEVVQGEVIPKATHTGVLEIGSIQITCYVLENGQRVISKRGMVKALGMKYGSNSSRADPLTAFAAQKPLEPLLSQYLPALGTPIKFLPLRGGNVGHGFEATVLHDICQGVLSARSSGLLPQRQLHIADQCEILVRGFARVGIIALVDEATGYQYDRPRRALEEILERFIAKELVAWQKTFPDDFYENIFRLKGWKVTPGSTRRPMILAKLTVDLVYKRLAPGVLKELRNKSPKDEKGRRKNKLFQWLTEDVGNPKLKEHFAALRSLWRVSDDYDTFYALANRALPMYGETLDLPFQIEHEGGKGE